METKPRERLVNHNKLTLEEPGCLTLEEPGCIVFEVSQNHSNPNKFDVYEEFTDKASFEAHQARVKASYWGRVSANVQRYYEILE